MSYKVFTDGSPLMATDINNNLMNQSVMVFANAAARTAAILSPTEGMVTYRLDTHQSEYYNGTAWRIMADVNTTVSGIPVFGTYDATKPLKRLLLRQNNVADSNGIVLIAVPNTAVIFASMTVETTTAGVAYPILRSDLTNATQVAFQLRNLAAAGAALASVAYTVLVRVEYQ